jgi:hypothetical protein
MLSLIPETGIPRENYQRRPGEEKLAQSRYDRFVQRLPSPLRPVAVAVQLLYEDWLIYILLNLLWTLATFTLLLGPPATFGLFYAAQRSVDGRVVGWRDLVQGGKQHFGQSWLWMIANLLVFVLVGYAFLFYQAIPADWARGAQWAMAALFLLWVTLQLYALHQLIVQPGTSLRTAWYRAGYAIYRRPFHALVTTLTVLVLVAFAILTQGLGFVLVGPGFVALLIQRAGQEAFKR